MVEERAESEVGDVGLGKNHEAGLELVSDAAQKSISSDNWM